jgi:hypothetical protein
MSHRGRLTTVIAGNVSNMSSTCVAPPPGVAAALDALDAAVATVGRLDFDSYDPATRLCALERLETARRRQLVAGHDVIASLVKEEPADVGGPVHKIIADWLRISCAEARRRIRDTDQLTARVTITGETLPPEFDSGGRNTVIEDADSSR